MDKFSKNLSFKVDFKMYFSAKKFALYSKNAILCLFLKNVAKVCFILNNLLFPIVKGIAFLRSVLEQC